MEKTPGGWTVIDRDAGVLAHTYEFSKGATATTFCARLSNGSMLVISPSTGLTDAAAAELVEFGPVAAIVANNGFHHLGQDEWRKRFPDARCFASKESAARIKKKSEVQLDFEPLSAIQELTSADVGIRDVPNTKVGEMWCWAKIEGGYAWFVSDILANLPTLPSSLVPKLLFKMTKSAPGYRVFNIGMKFMVKDKKATLRLLLEDMQDREPSVVVPSHGGILSQEGLAEETRSVIQASL